ncbi:Pumilio -like proteiny domain family member 6 [Ceratocystis fimbriata CBS 114723]|uniref:Pumilio-like proteiny domain family member 6 n=1 Tax=Ceratocystis fimbriata CBS 114723 TaxID=1035309 RepID=A0A2C5WUW8_9PEZI|nr:Pumilio -like proteiny domain family member 6 [Ceratocystis fimbriata CBS 114723]
MAVQAAGSKRKASGNGKPSSSSSPKKAKLQIRPKDKESGSRLKKTPALPPTISSQQNDSDSDEAEDFEAKDTEMVDFSDSEEGGVSLHPDRAKVVEARSQPPREKETSRESHMKQKQLAKERRAAKPLADEIARTKKLWERLRRKSHVPTEERKKLVEELFQIISGRMKTLVLKHDATRAVQTAIKYATPEQRQQIAKELKGSYATLASGRYAKFLVCKLISYSDDTIRDLIVPEFYGKIRKMIHHPEASWTLEDIYRVAATKKQRAIILREWYGVEFTLLDTNTEEPTAVLADILAKEPMKRGPAMKSLLDLINSLIQKNMVGFSMLHDAMLQYFQNVQRDSPEFTEFYEMIRGNESGDLLKNMAFTKSGAHLVCLLLTQGTAKDRRAILKTFKDTFILMSGDTNAHRILLTAFDVIDDTKMTSKAIFPELFGETFDKAGESLLAASQNIHARVTLLYLLEGTGLSTMFTGPKDEVRSLMEEVHELRKTTSKKDPEVRRKELVAAMSPQLLQAIADCGTQMVHDHYGCQLMSETIFAAEGDKTAALKTIANAVAGNPNEMLGGNGEDGETQGLGLISRPHPALTAHGGRLIKSLISGGKFNKATGQTIRVEPALKFANVLFPVIKPHVLEWATGPSSFVIVNMLDAPDFDDVAELRKILSKGRSQLEKAAREGGTQKYTKEQSEELAKKKKKNNSKRPPRADPGNKGAQIILERLG